MKTCPNCKKEIPDEDWNCPYCHTHVGTSFHSTGHSKLGVLQKDKDLKKDEISNEDKSMLKEEYDSADDDQSDYDY